MQQVTPDTIEQAAASVWQGACELHVTNPADGVAYRFSPCPDSFAGEVGPLGNSGYRRHTYAMRRLDGAEMSAAWGSTTLMQTRDVYGPADLVAQITGTLDKSGKVAVAPFYGPHIPTNSDKIWAWDLHTDALKARYSAAYAARDWAGVREALRLFYAEFPRWAVSGSGDLRSSTTVIARNMRGEKHPPRWHVASRYRHGRGGKGFAAHVAIERATLDSLAQLHALPGFTLDDDRAVIPVVMRWTGQARHFTRAELYAPGGRFLHPVKPDGTPMPRARSEDRSAVASIKPARRAKASAAA